MSDPVDDRREVAALAEASAGVAKALRRESARWRDAWPKLSPDVKLARWKAVCKARLELSLPIEWRGRYAHSTVLPDTYDGTSFCVRLREWL